MGSAISFPVDAALPVAKAENDVASPSESKCPVDHSKLSEKQLAGFMHRFSSASSQETQTDFSNALAETPKSGCPVDHKNMSKSQLTALTKNGTGAVSSASAARSATEAMAKASKGSAAAKDATYDVYGQVINTNNMMPATPNQLPSPGQSAPLSTARQASTIPKAGAGDGATWTYPSAQMFFNALKRKGKADDVSEDDMASVVAVHNTMNERTWAEVAAWEKRFHCTECPTPKLKRFLGRPHDLSPAARFRTWFRGYPQPFDRHDWIIDRCGATDVRYIIDYYYRDDGPDPIEIHVRPALDSPAAAWDRLRAAVPFLASATPAVGTAAAPATALPVIKQDVVSAEEYEYLRTLTPAGIKAISDAVQTECAGLGENFRKCREEGGACEDANVSLNYCMARQICKPAADRFLKVLESNGDEVRAYEDMAACLERFHVMARRVMMHAAGITQQGPEFPTAHAPASAAEEA